MKAELLGSILCRIAGFFFSLAGFFLLEALPHDGDIIAATSQRIHYAILGYYFPVFALLLPGAVMCLSSRPLVRWFIRHRSAAKRS